MKSRKQMRWNGACVVALWMSVACAWGGISSPLYVGNLDPVLNQYGRPMMGSNVPAGAATGSRVEIRVTTNGIIRPPATNGAAHPYHPLVNANSVGGMGMNMATPNSGLFCMVFSNRPPTSVMIFARVFNAPTAAEATFYADSKAVVARADEDSLVFSFGPVQPLDPGDADGDGLNNSWEKALGIDDRLTADYDGDGMNDLQEMLAGTDSKDLGSLLEILSIRREAAPALAAKGAGQTENCAVRIRWQSVPGRRYQLQFLPTLLGEQVPIPMGEIVTAGEGEFELENAVEVPEEAVTGSFRVRLVTEVGN